MEKEILQYLTLSLSPVLVIGIGVLLIKIARKASKDDKNSPKK